MEHPFLYLFVFLGLLGLVCAICAAIFIRADAKADDASSGAQEGRWPQ